MSVRAYKIIEIKTESTPTFNCWEEQAVINLATNLDQYNDGGILEFDKNTLQKTLKDTTYSLEQKMVIKAIIKDCGKDYSVSYQCF